MANFLSDADFERFRSIIYEESGIHFSASNRSILESRLRERLRRAKLDDIGQYYELITSDGNELKTLLDSVTTNLTRFFRNAAHMKTFEFYVIPDLIERKRKSPDKKVRIWSAGCSTGEEAYSVAMVLDDVLPKEIEAEVVASDISLKSVMMGKEGFYPTARVADVPEKYLNRYFEAKDAGYRVADKIREMVRFDYHNLKNDSGLRNLDVVFCRNVLIYFDEPAQKAVIDKFSKAMAPHSYLFIGHSESLFGMESDFEFTRTDWAHIYKKKRNG
jgi:chemotaxis protein methyltransferase CheR